MNLAPDGLDRGAAPVLRDVIFGKAQDEGLLDALLRDGDGVESLGINSCGACRAELGTYQIYVAKRPLICVLGFLLEVLEQAALDRAPTDIEKVACV